jgi:hypothetical protein
MLYPQAFCRPIQQVLPAACKLRVAGYNLPLAADGMHCNRPVHALYIPNIQKI